MSNEGIGAFETPYVKDIREIEKIRGVAFPKGEQPADPNLVLRVSRLLEEKGGIEVGVEEVAESMNKYYETAGIGNQKMTPDEVRSIYEKFLKKVA